LEGWVDAAVNWAQQRAVGAPRACFGRAASNTGGGEGAHDALGRSRGGLTTRLAPGRGRARPSMPMMTKGNATTAPSYNGC
jgi:hypothetical protein